MSASSTTAARTVSGTASTPARTDDWITLAGSLALTIGTHGEVGEQRARTVRLVAEDDDQRRQRGLTRHTNGAVQQRLAADLQEHLVPPHAARHAGGEHDACDGARSPITRHGSRLSLSRRCLGLRPAMSASSSASTLMAICSGPSAPRSSPTGPKTRNRSRAGFLREARGPLARPQEPDVEGAAGEQAPQPFAVLRERVGHDDRRGARADRQRQAALVFGPQFTERRGRRKAIARQVSAAVIDHRHAEADVGRVRDERPRVVAGAAHDEVRRRHQRFGEGARLLPGANRLLRLSGVVFRSRATLLLRGGVDRRRQHAAFRGENAPACIRPFEDRGECERRVGAKRRLERREDRERGRRRGRLHEDVDRSVAAEAEAPDRSIVGTCVVVQQPGNAGPDRVERVLAHVGFEAAAADAAARPAVVFDEELGARPPVGGAHDADNGRERSPAAAGGKGSETSEEIPGLFPALHSSRLSVCG